MFLLPSLFLGLLFAVVLGGKPARLLEIRFRLPWTVALALAIQIALFTRLGAGLPYGPRSALHLLSYALLVVFAGANLRMVALGPVLLGMVLNAFAIAANGGVMPVSPAAAHAAGLSPGSESNLSEHAGHLWFLGDVFALPARLPLANVFSVGDVLIALGLAAFIVLVSVGGGERQTLNPRRLLQPLATPAYRRLAAGKLASFVGDWLTLAALVGWIYERTGSTTQVAALLLVRLAPPILGGSVASLVVDRLPKRRVLVGVELGRGLAVACALLAVLGDSRTLVFAAIAASGVLGAVSAAAAPALVPSLLPAEQLPAANAGLAIANDVAMAAGAVGAGVALHWTGAPAALAIDLMTFGVAAFLYARLPGVEPAREEEDHTSAFAGLRYLLGRRSLLLLVFSFAAATLATGLTQASLPRFLDGSIGPSGYGFGMAALAAGLALGEALVGFTRVGPTAGRWIGAGLLFMAGLFALLGMVEHAPTALFLLAAIGFIDGTTDVLFDTAVQREAEPRHYGAVFGFSAAMTRTTMMAAVAVSPLANRLVDPHGVILGASVFLVLAGCIALAGMRARSSEAAVPSAQVLAFDVERRAEPQLAAVVVEQAAVGGMAAPVAVGAPPPPPATPPLVRRPGEQLTLVTWGGTAIVALAAADQLGAEGVSVEVVDLPQLASWDVDELLASVRKTSRVLVLHDDTGPVGRPADLAATIAELGFGHLRAPVRRLHARDAASVAAGVRTLLTY